jgi:SAM-dependent methyltransferase
LDKLTAFGRARRHRPLFLIDLAMPRDIDPAVQKLDGIYLYDLDSLRSIAGRTLAVRKQESQRCHQLIERHVHEFQSWMERTQALNLLSSGEYSQMAFDYARSNPDGYGAVFSKAMSGFSAIQSAWALEALRDYDFSSISTWCDVGGGHGHMMCSFLDVYSGLSGTVLDLPEVIAETRQLWVTKLGLEERCRYLSGDMFKRVPVKADVYSLKMILHDWNDTECAQILQNIRRAAKPGGRVFIIEHIVPGPNQPHFSKLFDIHMMCWGSGQERTEEEYASLLNASGWRLVTCHYPPHASMGVIEGIAT